MVGLLYLIATILIVCWVVGFLFAHVAAPVIHLLLVIGLAMLVYNMITGGTRRAV